MAADALTCFGAGTRIATLSGAVAVEDLRATQVVRAAYEGLGSVAWVGRAELVADSTLWPVRIAAGAFGNGVPERDLRLSPDHGVFVADPSGESEGVLIPAGLLVNGSSIVQEPVDRAVYYYVELEAHDVVVADGLTVESGRGLADREQFEWLSMLAPHPDDEIDDFADEPFPMCAGMLRDGPGLERVRARLAELAPAPTEAPEPVPETAVDEPEPETMATTMAAPEVDTLEPASKPDDEAFAPPDVPPAPELPEGPASNLRPRRLDRYLAVFSEQEYLRRNFDVANAVHEDNFACGLAHYLINGFRERRSMCAFDPDGYARRNPAALAAVGRGEYEDLLHHYVEVGLRQGYPLG